MLCIFTDGTNEVITGNTKLESEQGGPSKSEKKLWPIIVGKEWLQSLPYATFGSWKNSHKPKIALGKYLANASFWAILFHYCDFFDIFYTFILIKFLELTL